MSQHAERLDASYKDVLIDDVMDRPVVFMGMGECRSGRDARVVEQEYSCSGVFDAKLSTWGVFFARPGWHRFYRNY